MSFLDILYKILIGPLQLVFEIIFTIANQFIGHPGFAIIVLSLIMNFLVLPLYRRADALQEEERDIQAKLQDGVAHIKKTFTGDERMMMLQEYYRRNNYKPTDALHGSVSLLLEIPFFIAAYQFLSHLQVLQGVSLGPIRDLGSPDALLVIGGLSINILPILMTTINVVSSAIYLKGFPLKAKVQLYGMAAIFLVFLYNSPAGLVFYWTLNNIFSCLKNIFYKLKNPRKVLGVLFSIAGLLLFAYGLFIYDYPSLKRKVFLLGVGILFQLPLLMVLLKNKIKLSMKATSAPPNQKIFLLGSVFITILVGLLIPSNFIAASPQEFVDITFFHNPLWYLVNSACLATGTFLVWMRVFYWLASDSGKVIFDKVVWILCGVMLVNYMFFGTDLGILSSNLQYENGLSFTLAEQLVNIAVLAVIALVMYLIFCKWNRVLSTVLLTAVIAVGGMSGLNIYGIQSSITDVKLQAETVANNMPHFNLSTEGKNVIVLMLDRAMNQHIPYIMNEKPELKKQFAGFTHYSNTLSYGGTTNFAAPALFGGYEYTPIELNKRNSELLVSKHNEALKVMPVLFGENGYDVTVCDPVYANYQWVPDLSIYSDYPEIQTYITEGRFNDISSKEINVANTHRNFFSFSIMKTLPLFMQQTIYDDGNYNKADVLMNQVVYSTQTIKSNTESDGLSNLFMKSYNVLLNLPNITRIEDDSSNTFLMMTNNTTHEPMLLQEPEYMPLLHVDNTEYDATHTDRFIINERVMKMETREQIIHYQSNMATMIQLGKWFDYMRENNVFDNTRIIIVSDHGRALYQFDELNLGGKSLDRYYPLLLVKDFDSKEFTVSTEFMTNADVPVLATHELIYQPINPFTGNPINNDKKSEQEQYVITSAEWEVTINNGTTFLPSTWFAVKGDIWDKNNWRYIDEVTTMPSELLE